MNKKNLFHPFCVSLLFVLHLMLFCSCENKYEYYCSKQGQLILDNPNVTAEDLLDLSGKSNSFQYINVAVDIYRKKDGDRYSYMAKDQNGNEHRLSYSSIGNDYVSSNFRYENYVGQLRIKLE